MMILKKFQLMVSVAVTSMLFAGGVQAGNIEGADTILVVGC
jgi:hypothetical protein